MLAQHVAAVKALIPTVTAALHDSQVPEEPTYPYNFLYTNGGVRESSSLAREHGRFDASLYIATTATTVDSARIIQDAVRDALLGVRPVVAGRSCWMLEITSSLPIREDTDVRITGSNLHPMYGVDVWRLASEPA